MSPGAWHAGCFGYTLRLRTYSPSLNVCSSFRFHHHSPFPSKPAPLLFPRHLHFIREWLIPVHAAFCFSLSVAFCLSLCNGSRIIWGEVPVVHHTSIKPSFAKEVITQIKHCTNRGGTAAPTHLISVASTKYVCQIWWVLFVAFPFLAHNGIQDLVSLHLNLEGHLALKVCLRVIMFRQEKKASVRQ